jgi:hypothetical protein
MATFTAQDFEIISRHISNRMPSCSVLINARRFKALFGVSASRCAHIWRRLQIDEVLPSKATPKHLLWALYFLKVYDSENNMAGRCGCDEKTLRKWIWKMIDALCRMDIVSDGMDL